MDSRRIHILPEHVANQIAAGEVIQRPESVVKELVENSLDAGATSVLVAIKDGGKKLVHVVDDGEGMSEQDAATAFLRHATSKISSAEDLEAIRTYGFRGEALASIAAVAQVTMKTRRRDSDVGVVVQIEGGNSPRVSYEAREPGTSIAVHNLFYNTPARRKFLKAARTEFRHVAETVQRLALSHSEIALKFISDDEVLLDLKPATLEARLLDIFGQRMVEGMVPVEESFEVLSIHGYIGKPTFGQKSRVHQYLFLNNRYIVSRNISHAVFSAYENLLIKGTFPFFVLFLDIDPHRVDVNVHPSKLDAKFEDEQYVYRCVSSLVRKALAANNLVPSVSVNPGQEGADVGLSFTERQHAWRGETVDPKTGEIFNSPAGVPPLQVTAGGGSVHAHGVAIVERLIGAGSGDVRRSAADELAGRSGDAVPTSPTIVWQLHNKYILVPIAGGLLVVDQHVAHERVLYEQALRRAQSNAPGVQQLMFPQTVHLAPADYALVIELLPYFEQLGFALKPFGRNTILLEGVPSDLGVHADGSVIMDVLTLYREYNQHGGLEARDVLAKSYACRAAVKAGDALNEHEMRTLLDQLARCTMPYVCPHGRPVALKLSLDELDRRFGRT